MTTIVVDNNVVYGDGQSTSGDTITSYNVKKIANLGTAIVAGAGRWSHVVKFQQWVSDNIAAEHAQLNHPEVEIAIPEKMVAEDFLGIVLYPDGTVLMFEGCNDYYEVEQPISIGSGSVFALGALAVGSDGVAAVEAAIQLDPYTAGEIQVEGFEEEPEGITKELIEGLTKEEIINTLFPSNELDEDMAEEQYLDMLKATADDNGIKYSWNIGAEKLYDKVKHLLTVD